MTSKTTRVIQMSVAIHMAIKTAHEYALREAAECKALACDNLTIEAWQTEAEVYKRIDNMLSTMGTDHPAEHALMTLAQAIIDANEGQ